MADYKLFYSISAYTGSSGAPIILFDNAKVIGIHFGYDKFFQWFFLKSENSEEFDVSEKIREEFNVNKDLEMNVKVNVKNYNSIVEHVKEFILSLVIIFSQKDIEIRNNKYDIIKE